MSIPKCFKYFFCICPASIENTEKESSYFYDLFYFSFFLFLLLFKYSCLHFPVTTFSCPTHPQLLLLILPPFGFVHGSFIHTPRRPFPFFPLLSSPLVTVCSLFQCLWFYFACLFVLLCSTYRWDHMVFVFHHVAYFT